MVMGDKSGLTDDCTSGESRDVSSLDLPGVQEDLVRAVLDTGTAVVLVLVAGRPIGSASLHERCAAVLMAWLPGEEGRGGDRRCPGRRRQPRRQAADHLSAFRRPHPDVLRPQALRRAVALEGRLRELAGGPAATRSATARASRRSPSRTPSVLAGDVPWDGAITTTTTVTNTGDRDGDEVVQLYVRDPRASVTRPVLELKGFVRVALDAGQSRRITFSTPVGQLGFSRSRPGVRCRAGGDRGVRRDVVGRARARRHRHRRARSSGATGQTLRRDRHGGVRSKGRMARWSSSPR